MTSVEVVAITGAVGTWGEFVLSGAGTCNVGRFCTADISNSSNIGTTYPIVVPTAGGGYGGSDYNYSYHKTHFLKFSSFDDTEIKNIRWYTDGTNFDTGITVWVGISGTTANNGMPSSNYLRASGTQGTTGNPFWTKPTFYYSSIRGQGVQCSANANNYTSAAPLWVQSGASNKIEAAGYSWGVIEQLQAGTTATSGKKSPEQRTFKYNVI